MFRYLVISHKSGNSTALDINDYSIGDLTAIRMCYEANKDYEIEEH